MLISKRYPRQRHAEERNISTYLIFFGDGIFDVLLEC
jgi:hypothetical protein